MGTTTSFPSGVITLNCVPERIIIYATKATYVGTNGNPPTFTPSFVPQDGDWFLPIQNISVTMDNAPNLLANVPMHDLWQRSLENGSPVTWEQYRGFAGSAAVANNPAQQASGVNYPQGPYQILSGGPLILAPGKDIQLFGGLAPGVPGNFAFSFVVSLLNSTLASIPNVVLNVVVVNSGFFSSASGRSSRVVATITLKEVLDSAETDVMSSEDPKAHGSLAGGSRFHTKNVAQMRGWKRDKSGSGGGASGAGSYSGGGKRSRLEDRYT